jgi:ribonuclease-3
MTRRRAAIVRRETLARAATSIGLGAYLSFGKGEESSGGREKPLNLAGAMEAVIAAVYLDQGMYTTRQMVHRLLEGEWNASEKQIIDYKSRLQEVCQAKYQCIPVYRLVRASGPDHDPQFSVEVRIRNRVAGRAVGKSKKQAETEAARLAMEAMDRDFTVR